MNTKKPIAGIDYWPNENEWLNPTPEQPTLFHQALLFILLFVCLQFSWLSVRDYTFGHFIRGEITVKPVVTLINLLSPQIHAVAFGNQIIAHGGGLIIKLGCEGVEALFILIAAIATTSLSRASMLKGIFIGAIYIYALNQARILILFYTNRTDKVLFHLLHTTVAPMVLIALVGLFFQWWLKTHQSSN
ncbi:exosortase/archaeosortase family protein [Methylotenera sp.]|uniref:exosortase/archaeosortase family protein n=1 Tax=Methylotenera sp. TaxID=2051956 RepID=UPI00248A2966|nr:exosortase/archaeosortase family protein [Methylotenera sp.]MDI1361805.1 exosortase/archaeosortase family protein [Methylotenera sp.]